MAQVGTTEIELSQPEDVRAVQTFILYLRHMPITLIERAQNISRRTVYRDIDRAKELFRIDPATFAPDLFFETAESLREAWQNYQNADNKLREGAEEKERLGLEIQKSTYLGMIDKMLRTRIEAAKLLIPKSESLTVEQVQTEQGIGTRVTLERKSKSVTELMEELRKEGKIGGEVKQ